MKYGIIGAAVLAVGGVAVLLWPDATSKGSANVAAMPGEMVTVTLPSMAGDALIGQRVFAARCAACHGPNAGGIDGAGPPLVHKYYEPNHHGDAAFFIAAQQGVRAHHWRFGNMPPVEGVTRAEIASVVAFVRSVQRENGIF